MIEPLRRLYRASMFKLSGKTPDDIGVKDSKLAACPDKPNCVCSQADAGESAHYIAPLKFTQDASLAMQRLLEVVRSRPRVQVVKQDDRYLHVEFRSKLLGFVDDVEFYLVPDRKLIHVRSASRLGYSDLGVNRKRVEAIRAEFEKG